MIRAFTDAAYASLEDREVHQLKYDRMIYRVNSVSSRAGHAKIRRKPEVPDDGLKPGLPCLRIITRL
jgi:hypothetical protein